MLPPTLRYLLVLATQRQPRYLLRVLNSFDELYALLMLVVERHFLKTYGGGFTEHFYGLKRERALRISGGKAPRTQIAAPALMRETLKLTTADIWKNLAVMVGVPYIKRKLDESYDIHAPQAILLGPSYNRDTLPLDATVRQRVQHYYKWFLRHIYPSVNAAYYFSILAFNLAYLFSNTSYSSPFLWLVQTRIRRMGEADHRAIAAAAAEVSRPGQSARPGQQNSIFHPRTLATSVLPRMLSSLQILLPTSIFALKFLEWWHASDFARQLSRKAAEGLELPPPVISGLPLPAKDNSDQKAKSSSPLPGVKPNNSVSLANRPPSPVTERPSASTIKRPSAPISATSSLPILTVPAPTRTTSTLCPICLHPIVTPTAVQTGYVFCYTCIYKWVDGTHDRQEAWMKGEGTEEGWGDDEDSDEDQENNKENDKKMQMRSREGHWESGKGRCAVTGRRVLGETEGLRRVMV